MRARHGRETFSYGNFRNQHPDSLVQGWETYDARPRFGTNWIGLARPAWRCSARPTATTTSPPGWHSTYDFVREVLSEVAARSATTMLGLTASPAETRLRRRPVHARPADAQRRHRRDHRAGGRGRRGICPAAAHRRVSHHRDAGVRPVRGGPRKEAVPEAYLIPARLSGVVGLLRRHGVVVERGQRVVRPASSASWWRASRREPLFERHRPTVVDGHWRPAAGESSAPAGIGCARPAAGRAGSVPSGARVGGRPRHLEPAGCRAGARPSLPYSAKPTAAAATAAQPSESTR